MSRSYPYNMTFVPTNSTYWPHSCPFCCWRKYTVAILWKQVCNRYH